MQRKRIRVSEPTFSFFNKKLVEEGSFEGLGTAIPVVRGRLNKSSSMFGLLMNVCIYGLKTGVEAKQV